MKKNKSRSFFDSLEQKADPVVEEATMAAKPSLIEDAPELESTSVQEPESVSEAKLQPEQIDRVKVMHPKRKRKLPALSGDVVGYITDQGVYEITEIVNGWGKLQDGSWIMLQYTEFL